MNLEAEGGQASMHMQMTRLAGFMQENDVCNAVSQRALGPAAVVDRRIIVQARDTSTLQ